MPERVVHARGAAAFGFFEAYGSVGGEPISRYIRAKLFHEKGALMSRYGSPPQRHNQDELARELTELAGPGPRHCRGVERLTMCPSADPEAQIPAGGEAWTGASGNDRRGLVSQDLE